LLTPDQLVEVFNEQRVSGRRFGEIAVERGWLSSAELALAIARQYELVFIDLSSEEIDPDVATLLSEGAAAKYQAIPLRWLDETNLLVGVVDPADVAVRDGLRMTLGTNLTFAVVEKRDLEIVLHRLHRQDITVAEEKSTSVEESDERQEILDTDSTVPAVKLINSALSRAIEDGASDVHFDPEEDRMIVRARIDGVVRELTSIPRSLQPAVTTRLKIMGSLDIAERRIPQDGRVLVRRDGHPVDLRMAVLPTVHGEKVVLRLLQRSTSQITLTDLGMSPEAEAAFTQAVRQPYGAVIACGPTGSGKTTTLYAALTLLNEPGRVLITIEDPVEYQSPGIAQMEVNVKSGLTFARGLRTVLRSDPDVLLVGEIRDEETARIAVQAAMTGHLILTSLHAHSAASAVARLKDIGVDPSLLAASVNCIVAQRLARRLCVQCREPYAPSRSDLEEIGLSGEHPPITLFRARGCIHCARTGYAGRVALYEVMLIDAGVASVMSGSTQDIFAAAVEHGMIPLQRDGIRLCLTGVSSLEEVRRVTGDRAG
jgi:type IV pilus assembly protein PilB